MSISSQDLQLGPSWVLVLLNAQEIGMQEKRLDLKMVLHVEDNRPEKGLKNGSFLPQNGPPHRTTVWETPY